MTTADLVGKLGGDSEIRVGGATSARGQLAVESLDAHLAKISDFRQLR